MTSANASFTELRTGCSLYRPRTSRYSIMLRLVVIDLGALKFLLPAILIEVSFSFIICISPTDARRTHKSKSRRLKREGLKTPTLLSFFRLTRADEIQKQFPMSKKCLSHAALLLFLLAKLLLAQLFFKIPPFSSIISISVKQTEIFRFFSIISNCFSNLDFDQTSSE